METKKTMSNIDLFQCHLFINLVKQLYEKQTMTPGTTVYWQAIIYKVIEYFCLTLFIYINRGFIMGGFVYDFYP